MAASQSRRAALPTAPPSVNRRILLANLLRAVLREETYNSDQNGRNTDGPLKPIPILEVPEETARIAHAAFPKGNIYLRIRDRLGVSSLRMNNLSSLFPKRGSTSFCARGAWRLYQSCSLLKIYRIGEAANAVRSRIDWKYLLGLEMEDAGFDYSILSEFRQRIIDGRLEQMLLDSMLTVPGGAKPIAETGETAN